MKKKYLFALKKEWDRKKKWLLDKKIASIYFGGGTPTLLSSEELSFIFSFFKELIFCDDIEITLEANPETVNLSFLKHIRTLGINRISLGVQSLNNEQLQMLGRTHNAFKALHSIELIHASGIENISIDLMYDLPNQSPSSFEDTLKQLENLSITHISLYNLTIEPHTFFYRKKNQLRLPSDEESLIMHQRAIASFSEIGFVRYEISAFCKKGFESKHNSGYWLGRPFLGFGPSAFSYWDKSRFSNISNITEYARRENPEDFREKLSESEHYKELLAIRLRVFEPFSLLSLSEGKVPLETLQQIEKLIDQGFIERQNDLVQLSEKGALFYDSVAQWLI